MEQTVYGDLLFFVNFCMDFQCLFLTTKLLRRPFFVWRSALASALGALYACAALFLPFSGVVAFLLDLAVCFFMCALSFLGSGQSFARLPIPFGLYFGVSFAVGGVMSGMATLLSRADLPLLQTGRAGSTFAFFLLAALGGLATFLWGRLCQRRAKGARVALTLVFEEREITVQGLVDTANLLTDPVGGRPVVILDRRAAAEWLPAPLLRAAERGADGVAQLAEEYARRVRLVSAETVTGGGLLLGVLPDKALLDAGKAPHAVELLVAVAPLSVPADCRALLPAILLTE